jgi:prepilin-type N-terminal cleavage/methylation domain-containing protein
MRGRTVNDDVTKRPPSANTGGFSFIELMVSITILSMLLLGFAATSSAAARQRELSDQKRRAEQALSVWLAELRALSFTQLTAAAGTSTVTIDGLTGATRQLTIYDDEAGPAGDPTTTAALAMPLDINADGDTTDADVAPAAAAVLPARLTLTWTDPAIQTQLEVRLYVYFSVL